MPIKLYDYGGGLDVFAQAIPAAIEGYYKSKQMKNQEMEMQAKLAVDRERKEREQALDRMRIEENYVIPEGTSGEDVYGLVSGGMLKHRGGGSGLMGGGKTLDEEYKKLRNQKIQKDIAEKDTKSAAGKTLIPGYEHDESVPISPTEIPKLRKAAASRDELVSFLNEVENITKGASTQDLANPLSKVRKQLDSLISQSQIKYKGPQYAELGVLAGPDMTILDQIIENPGSISNLVSGKDDYLDRLSKLRSTADTNVENQFYYSGFKRTQDGPQGPLNKKMSVPPAGALSPEEQKELEALEAEGF